MIDELPTPAGVIRRTGASVYGDYDQAMLDACYDQNVWAPNRSDVQARVALACDETRKRLGPPLRFAYGSTAIEGIDVFSCGKSSAPICLYVHGGAWRAGSAHINAAPARMFVDHGVHYAVVDFTDVIQSNGDLSVMVEQLRRACVWLHHNSAEFGGDPRRLYVHGHSSGGHLTSVLLTTDWAGLFGLRAKMFCAGMVSSGMYDLAPVRLSARSAYVRFSDETVRAFSAIHHLQHIHCPIVVSYGSCESPEFIRQNQSFAAAALRAGHDVRLQCGVGFNHFELAETFANPYGFLGQTMLGLISGGDSLCEACEETIA
jgi:arylformamidase